MNVGVCSVTRVPALRLLILYMSYIDSLLMSIREIHARAGVCAFVMGYFFVVNIFKLSFV